MKNPRNTVHSRRRLVGLATTLMALAAAPLASAATAENGVNLNGVNLNGVNLNGVNLNGVNLNGVNLNGVNLQGVNLNGVSLNAVDATLNTASEPAIRIYSFEPASDSTNVQSIIIEDSECNMLIIGCCSTSSTNC